MLVFDQYRYQGRHRAPSHTSRNVAAVSLTAAAALTPTVLATPAHAGPPGGWGPIIECESGGNPNAENPSSTASGLFQFLNSTWRSVGGSGSASSASVDEQYRRAEMLYDRAGTSPWAASRSCWAGKSAPEPVIRQASTASAPSGRGGESYTVQPGDTLSKIAPSNWREVAVNNGIENANLIYVGQVIQL
jgi:hypothetical protein